MKQGYYWIQYNSEKQIAYFANEEVDDLESGETIMGVWYVTRGDDFANNNDIEVLSECLEEPNN